MDDPYLLWSYVIKMIWRSPDRDTIAMLSLKQHQSEQQTMAFNPKTTEAILNIEDKRILVHIGLWREPNMKYARIGEKILKNIWRGARRIYASLLAKFVRMP